MSIILKKGNKKWGKIMDEIKRRRNFMKANFNDLDTIETDQEKGLPQPLLEKEVVEGAEIIDLIPIDEIKIKNNDFMQCITKRRSRRQFKNKPLTLEQLSFLLWVSQGVKEVIERNDRAYATLRTVPSAGARHAFETYLIVHNVENLEPGLYRYCAVKHKLEVIKKGINLRETVSKAVFDQSFAGDSSVVFAWSAIVYRSEWRYLLTSHKVMLLDSGHVCQNLYLGCEAMGLGTCAIGAYDQKLMDSLLGIDGEEEFTVYLSPVGHYK